jgi:leukotriene-A4 hydrolase
VAHEIAHSWSGNLVTNASWKDFWLNEGFTVYIERMILGELHNSEPYRHFEAMIGYNDLMKTVADFGADSEWTKLQPNMNGIDPDEVFSKIPYEKGSLFLFYLETLVGGKQVMQKWLNKYFNTFKSRSVATEQMKEHFLNYFSSEEHKVSPDVLKKIDWDHWLTAPGLPSFDPREVFDKSLAENCLALAKKWREEGGNGATADDLKKFQAKQTMYFLDTLLATAMPMQHDLLHKLDNLYGLSASNNVEILFRWVMLCLKSNDKSIFPVVANFLSKHGRGLYVRPMYRALNEVDHHQAVRVYKDNRSFYHSVIRNMFDPVLSK